MAIATPDGEKQPTSQEAAVGTDDLQQSDEDVEEILTDGAKRSLEQESQQNRGSRDSADDGAPEDDMTLMERLAHFVRTFGPNHPDTLDCMTTAAKERMAIADYKTAATYYEAVLEGYQKTLGEEHKKTQRSARRLEKARALASKRDGKNVCLNRFFFFLMWGPGMLSVLMFGYELVQASGTMTALHDGVCVNIGLCTSYAQQLEEIYDGYTGFRRVEQLARIKAIPKLLQKWRGKEASLVEEVEAKYGVSKWNDVEDSIAGVMHRALSAARAQIRRISLRTQHIRVHVYTAVAVCMVAAIVWYVLRELSHKTDDVADAEERPSDSADAEDGDCFDSDDGA
eukprot:SAG11_NODE_1596_length_4611_cov_3.725842_1_plen_341_part_00